MSRGGVRGGLHNILFCLNILCNCMNCCTHEIMKRGQECLTARGICNIYFVLSMSTVVAPSTNRVSITYLF